MMFTCLTVGDIEVPDAYSVCSTDFDTRYLQEMDQLKERGKREEYLRDKVHMS